MKVYEYILTCFLVCILIGIGNCELAAQSKIIDKKQTTESSEESEQDNPFARQKLEWLQLRNPATGRIPANIREKELQFAKTLPTKEQQMMQMKKAGDKNNIQNYTWTQRGPYNIGGRTRALALDVNNDNTILAGGVNGGMWKSTDDGASWSEKTSPGDLQSVTCVAQNTRAGKTNVWYYGTGEFPIASADGGGFTASLWFKGNGIFKSTDDGNSWFQLVSTVSDIDSVSPFQFIFNIITNPANQNQDEVLAATFEGIMRSSDGGNTWNYVIPYVPLGSSIPFSSVAVTTTGVFYATLGSGSLYSGIWRSTDGLNWVNITPSGWPATFAQTEIAIAPSNENVVYFLSSTPGGGQNDNSLWKYTYLSGDGSGNAGTWEDRSLNLPAYGGYFGNFNTDAGSLLPGASWAITIKVKPDDENTVFIGGTALFRSTDGFASSSNTTVLSDTVNYDTYVYKILHPDEHTIVFSKSNSSVMYVGNDGGVFKTNNDMASPVTWTSLNNGYYTTQFYSAAIDHATTDDIITAGSQDNGTLYTNSNSASSPWEGISGGDGEICYIADGGSSYYTTYIYGGFDRILLDNNGNIISKGSIAPSIGPYYLISPFTVNPNNEKEIYYAAGKTIWRNSDVTAIPLGSSNITTVNWTELSNTSSSSFITAIGISKSPVNILYYGTIDGKLFRLDNSSTGDPTPTDIYSGKGLPSGAFVFCIAVDPNDGDKTIVSFSNYGVKSLFYTTDAGANWNSISGNLEQYSDGSGNGPSTRWVKILPNNGANIYFVATSTGVYSTTSLNGDNTVWTLEGANTIGNAVVDGLDVRQTDGLVVAATHGKGIFSTHVNSNPVTDTSGILISYDNNNPQTGAYETQPNNNWILANRLTAPNNAFKIDKLIYYINGDDSTGTASFYPVVYSGSITFFGMPANYPTFTGQLFTPVKGWNTIDVSSNNITNPNTSGNDFFVGIKYDGKDEPLIGMDTVSNGRGWEYNPVNSNWTQLDNYKPPFPATLYIRAVVSEVTGIVEIDNKVPKNFSLAQNYPNPFNPTTTIQYDLPKGETVKLKVYDILGREVAALVDAYQAAGTYKVQWNGRNNSGTSLASGIYLYSFEAGSYSSVKKMIYLK